MITEQIIYSWAFGLLFQIFNSFQTILIQNEFLTLNCCVSHGFPTKLFANQPEMTMHFTLRGFIQITFTQNKGEFLFELLRIFNARHHDTYVNVVLAYKTEIIAFFNVIKQIADDIDLKKVLKDNVNSTGTVRKLHHRIEFCIFK